MSMYGQPCCVSCITLVALRKNVLKDSAAQEAPSKLRGQIMWVTFSIRHHTHQNGRLKKTADTEQAALPMLTPVKRRETQSPPYTNDRQSSREGLSTICAAHRTKAFWTVKKQERQHIRTTDRMFYNDPCATQKKTRGKAPKAKL
jgi:hypothetical protein